MTGRICKSLFSILNKRFYQTACNQSTELPFDIIKREKDIKSYFPSHTVTTIRFNDSSLPIHPGLLSVLLKNYRKCKLVKINITCRTKFWIMIKTCKLLSKSGVLLEVENSPQRDDFKALKEKFDNKFIGGQ